MKKADRGLLIGIVILALCIGSIIGYFWITCPDCDKTARITGGGIAGLIAGILCTAIARMFDNKRM
jgi:hypothetical protein